MSHSAFIQSALPDVAIEIEAGRVAAARLTWRGDVATVAAHSVEPLAPGIVVPTLTALNISDVAEAGRAVAEAVSRLGVKTRRAALVIPDTAAKVSLVRFEKVPARSADLLELVRWQMRKSAPFPMEQAVVSLTPGIKPAEGGQEFVVTVARADVIAQYEEACTLAGIHAGLVDIASFSVVNGVLAGTAAPTGDWLLVHATPTYITLMVLRDRDLIFFRKAEETEGTLADVVHQTAMYYEDRLKGEGFRRVLLSAGGAVISGGADALRRSLEERLRLSVEAVDPRSTAALSDQAAATPELLDALAPLVGILVRERKVA